MVTPSTNGTSPQGMPALSIAAQQLVTIFEGLPLETRLLFVPKCQEFFVDEPVLQQVVVEKCPDLADRIAELLGKGQLSPRKKLPDVPDIRRDGRANVPSTVTVHAIMAACHSAQSKTSDKWRGGSTLPAYIFNMPHSSTMIELRPPGRDPQDDYQLSPEDMNVLRALITGETSDGIVVQRISSLTGDVFIALLMQYLGAPHDELGWQWITVDRILDYRGIQKKVKDGYSAGHQPSERDDIGACIQQLQHFWVTANEWQDGKKRFSYQTRLLMVKNRITQAELKLPTETDSDEPIPPSRTVAWQFQPGDWFASFRDGTNRMFADMLLRCIQYDPYHDLWESRLSKYFTMHLRINGKNAKTLTRRVGAVLEELSLPIDKRNPERTYQQFKQAMEHMAQDGVFAKWHYQDQTFEANRKARGWLVDWLNQMVVVTATAETSQQYQQIAEKVETRRERAAALKSSQITKQKQKQKQNREKGRS